MTNPEKFSLKKRGSSFIYAFRGIFYMFKTQHNSWIHASITILVITAGILMKLNLTEWCLIVICIGLVFIAEMFNTSIEKFVDFVSPEFNDKAGKIKDVGAGAVLFSTITSIITGLIIFLPKFMELLNQ
ncbi:MAG: diacylglycerol kinase family protein [Bacteroidota bacterium]